MIQETIKLKDLIRAGQKEVVVDEAYTYEDLPMKAPVRVQAHVRLTSTGVTVKGSFDALAEEPCDRCLEPFERQIFQRFDERYVYESLTDFSSASEMELHEEDFYDTIGPEGVLDLKDLVRQHLVLALSTDRICERDTCVIQSGASA
jgi:uncharacterized metal-binding protein YceD (DUF177 family)